MRERLWCKEKGGEVRILMWVLFVIPSSSFLLCSFAKILGSVSALWEFNEGRGEVVKERVMKRWVSEGRSNERWVRGYQRASSFCFLTWSACSFFAVSFFSLAAWDLSLIPNFLGMMQAGWRTDSWGSEQFRFRLKLKPLFGKRFWVGNANNNIGSWYVKNSAQ